MSDSCFSDPYQSLLDDENYQACREKLAQDVVDLLFNMQMPQIVSMQPLLEQLPDEPPASPRLTLMQYALNPECDTDRLSRLLDLFKQHEDVEGGCCLCDDGSWSDLGREP